MKTLKKLEEDGWNILYFSFRDTVKETIQNIRAENTLKELSPLKFGEKI